MNDIVICDLCKAYGEKQVLNHFSAVLPEGKITGLMAPSGGGKTTLLRILMHLEKADSGCISGLSGRRISTVFQEDRLCLSLTPEANIRLVNPGLSGKDAQRALSAVGLSDCLHQKTQELSGGMRRRVAILRALLADFDLLLLDEPFRGLDAETKSLVIRDTVMRIQNRTVLFVTHDPKELTAIGAENCLRL